MAIRSDPNEQKYWTLWQLSPFMPNYFRQLFKYSESIFRGMQREDLIEELKQKIKNIEQKMGVPIAYVYWVYENLPALNSFTKSKNPEYEDTYIYKHTLKQWFEEIEDWIFEKLIELEPEIRFTQLRSMT